jgi:hypothetical protein
MKGYHGAARLRLLCYEDAAAWLRAPAREEGWWPRGPSKCNRSASQGLSLTYGIEFAVNLIRSALDGDDVDDGATAIEEVYLGAGLEPEPSAALEGTGDRITVGVYDSGCPIETLSPGLARIFPFISTPGELLLTSPISESNTHKLKPYRLTSLILVEYRKVLYTTPALGELNLFEDHTYVARIAPNIRFREFVGRLIQDLPIHHVPLEQGLYGVLFALRRSHRHERRETDV